MIREPPPAGDAMAISQREDESEGRAIARLVMRPTVNTARTLRRVLKNDGRSSGLALTDLADELTEQCTKVCGGDLTRAVALLMMQSVTLDQVFHNLVRLAYDHLPEHSDTAERIFRLAFRAQGQSARTLETLALMKNPPSVFANQANIANGPQQVNNGIGDSQEGESGQNKLLEHGNGERLDTGTTSSAGGSDMALETVAALNGTANGGR